MLNSLLTLSWPIVVLIALRVLHTHLKAYLISKAPLSKVQYEEFEKRLSDTEAKVTNLMMQRGFRDEA